MMKALILAILLFAGCNDGGSIYRPCDLDPNSPNTEVATCGGDESPTATCIVDQQVQCDEGLCGRLNGSEPLCTQPCEADRDCDYDGDVCAAWGDLGMHCMPADWAEGA